MTGVGLFSLSSTAASNGGAAPASRPQNTTSLTPEQQAALTQLTVSDRRVRAHEQAHLAAAGPYATGGPSYTYAVGPDGHIYAVGGEVNLDVSPDPSNPGKTIEKARTIQAAANAPADPSNQDRMVAAAAATMESAAQQQLERSRQASLYAQEGPVPKGQLFSVSA